MFPDFEDTGIAMSDKDAVQAEWNARLESILALHGSRSRTIPGEIVCSNDRCKLSMQPAPENGLDRRDVNCYLCGNSNLIPITEELRNTRQLPDVDLIVTGIDIGNTTPVPILKPGTIVPVPRGYQWYPVGKSPAPKPAPIQYTFPLMQSPILSTKFAQHPNGDYFYIDAGIRHIPLQDVPLSLLRLIFKEARKLLPMGDLLNDPTAVAVLKVTQAVEKEMVNKARIMTQFGEND